MVGGKQVNVWSGWATRAEAERAIADRWRDIEADAGARARHRPEPERVETMRELLDAWLAPRVGLYRPATIEQNRKCAARVSELIGDYAPAEVTTPVLQAWIRRRLETGVGNGTVKQELMVIGQALKWGVSARRVELMALPTMPRITYQPKRTSRAPDVKTLRLMFAALRGVDAEVEKGLRLQAHIGARAGELHALRWSDVEQSDDPNGWYLTLRGKTGDRRIPISTDAVAVLEVLRTRRGEQPRPAQRVVTDRTYRGWCCRVAYVLRKLPWADWGVERVRPNDLRALFSQALRRAGASPEAIKDLAGHSAATAVANYWGTTDEGLRTTVGQLGIGADLDVQLISMPARSG